MNKIHPKGAFGAEFEGQLFGLLRDDVSVSSIVGKKGHAAMMAKKKQASLAATLAGFGRGKLSGGLVDIEVGRGYIGKLSRKTDEDVGREARISRAAI